MKKTSKLVTTCGLVEALGFALAGVPIAIIIAYANVLKDGPPHWFNVSAFPLVAIGVTLKIIGAAVGGWASKGQDDIPTVPQVEAATLKAVGQNLAEQAQDPSKDPNLGGK